MIQADEVSEGLGDIFAESQIVIANAPLILIPRRNRTLAPKAKAVELPKRVRGLIRYTKPAKNTKALRRIILLRVQILVKIINESPRALFFTERRFAKNGADDGSRILVEPGEISVRPQKTQRLMAG